jgi:hypothetical protein
MVGTAGITEGHHMKESSRHRIYTTPFASVYPLYVQKVEEKGRDRRELDHVICWLTGYTPAQLDEQIERRTNFETFFAEAPSLNPNAGKITGTICGVRIEEIEHPLMRNIRYLDKLVDELAKGRPIEKVLRS